MPKRVDIAMFKEAAAAWNADKAPRLAAAISYSTIFAIAPLLIITIAFVGGVLGFNWLRTPAHGRGERVARADLACGRSRRCTDGSRKWSRTASENLAKA